MHIKSSMVNLFPKEVRYTGFAFSRNVSAAIFGGLAPALCSWLTEVTQNATSSSAYLVICGLIGIVSLALVHENKKVH